MFTTLKIDNSSQKGPKEWQAFYKAFLANVVDVCVSKQYYSEKISEFITKSATNQRLHIDCLTGLLNSAEFYLNASRKPNFLHKTIEHCLKKQRCQQTEKCFHGSMQLLKPTKTIIADLMQAKCKLQFPDNTKTEMVWVLDMDRKLASRLTFHHISIQFGFQGMCHRSTSFSVVSLGGERQTFMFCGYIPLFTLYPPHHQVELHMDCAPQTTVSRGEQRCYGFNISFSFTVIDTGIIMNQAKAWSSQADRVQMQLKNVVVLKRNESIRSYHVQTNKRFFLTIMIPSSVCQTFQIFDGPNSLSDALSSCSSTCNTSTFQAFIMMLEPLRSSPQTPGPHLMHFKSVLSPLSAVMYLKAVGHTGAVVPDGDCP